MTIKEITIELQTSPTPGRMAELLVLLGVKYSEISSELENVIYERAKIWPELRAQHKSETSTERAWEATEGGLREMKLRSKQKVCEKLMSSIKTMVQVKTEEAKGTY